jgi:hypothetical protein
MKGSRFFCLSRFRAAIEIMETIREEKDLREALMVTISFLIRDEQSAKVWQPSGVEVGRSLKI